MNDFCSRRRRARPDTVLTRGAFALGGTKPTLPVYVLGISAPPPTPPTPRRSVAAPAGPSFDTLAISTQIPTRHPFRCEAGRNERRGARCLSFALSPSPSLSFYLSLYLSLSIAIPLSLSCSISLSLFRLESETVNRASRRCRAGQNKRGCARRCWSHGPTRGHFTVSQLTETRQ
jgi:hypothetical protein